MLPLLLIPLQDVLDFLSIRCSEAPQSVFALPVEVAADGNGDELLAAVCPTVDPTASSRERRETSIPSILPVDVVRDVERVVVVMMSVTMLVVSASVGREREEILENAFLTPGESHGESLHSIVHRITDDERGLAVECEHGGSGELVRSRSQRSSTSGETLSRTFIRRPSQDAVVARVDDVHVPVGVHRH